MSKVWEADFDHTNQLILLAMADHADDFGGSVYPSIGLIAWKTGYSVRQTQRIIQELLHSGVISVTVPSHGIRPAEYRINVGLFNPKPPMGGLQAKCSDLLRDETIARFSSTCNWCHRSGDQLNGPDGNPWNIDRMIPGSRGGMYTPDNVVLSCGHCNKGRGAKMSGVPNDHYRGAIAVSPRGAIAVSHEPSGINEPSATPGDLFRLGLSSTPSSHRERPKNDLFGDLIPQPFVGSSKFCEAWRGFVEMRMRKWPLTERAAKLIIAKLVKIGDTEAVIEALDQSTLNNWRDIYPMPNKVNLSQSEKVSPAKLQAPNRYTAFITNHPNDGVRMAYPTWESSQNFDPDGIRKAYYRWEKTGTY